MDVTVAICSGGRPRLLHDCLASMKDLDIPQDLRWEILVVNSGVAGVGVTERAVPALPLRVVSEPRAGLSHARNRAVAEARGKYIFWTDDDVLVDNGWLDAYWQACLAHPDAAIFGGPIQPAWDAEPPTWMVRALPRIGGAFALRDLGDDGSPLDSHRLPFGANYAVRSAVQQRFRYDPALGRRPGELGLGREETEVLSRMLSDGETGWWVPEAGVRHRIGSDRTNLAYLRGYFRAEGAYIYWRDRRQGAVTPAPVLIARLVRARLRYVVRRLTAEPETWILDLMSAENTLGQLQSWLARLKARVERAEQPR